MPINPNIAMGYRPIQLENPMNAMAQMSQIQNYQQTNQLNQMKMEEARLEQANVNAMNNAYKDAFNPETNSVDYNRLYKSLAASGQGSRIPGVQKLQFEGQQAGANLQKTQGEVNLQNATAALERVGNLEWNPSDANITSHIEDSIKRGDVTPAQGSAKLAEALSVPLDQRPAYFRQLGLTIKQRQDAADKVADRGVTTAGQKSVAGTAANKLLPMTPEVMAQEMRLRAAGRTPAATPAAQLHTDPESGAVWERDRNGVWKQAVGPGGKPIGSRKSLIFEDMDKAKSMWALTYPISTMGLRMNPKGGAVPEFNVYYKTEWPIAKQVAGIGGVARTPILPVPDPSAQPGQPTNRTPATARDTGILPIGQGTAPRTPATAQFQAPDDVKAAYRSGKISETEAAKILRDNFGFK